MFKKIAISGPAGSGKDYLAQKLARDENLALLSFARPIKEIVGHVLHVTAEEVDAIKEGRAQPERAPAMRVLLQKVGTEVFREYDPDIWVHNLLTRAERVEEEGRFSGVVVTDLRFRNEFNALTKTGFRTVRVDAPDHFKRLPPPRSRILRWLGSRFPDDTYLLTRNPYFHASERDLDSYHARFDHHVFNDRFAAPRDLLQPVVAQLRADRAGGR